MRFLTLLFVLDIKGCLPELVLHVQDSRAFLQVSRKNALALTKSSDAVVLEPKLLDEPPEGYELFKKHYCLVLDYPWLGGLRRQGHKVVALMTSRSFAVSLYRSSFSWVCLIFLSLGHGPPKCTSAATPLQCAKKVKIYLF